MNWELNSWIKMSAKQLVMRLELDGEEEFVMQGRIVGRDKVCWEKVVKGDGLYVSKSLGFTSIEQTFSAYCRHINLLLRGKNGHSKDYKVSFEISEIK